MRAWRTNGVICVTVGARMRDGCVTAILVLNAFVIMCHAVVMRLSCVLSCVLSCRQAYAVMRVVVRAVMRAVMRTCDASLAIDIAVQFG